jgi:hypothetical protein
VAKKEAFAEGEEKSESKNFLTEKQICNENADTSMENSDASVNDGDKSI